MTSHLLFATGIENSNPTIQNGRVRVDKPEKGGHYCRGQRCWPLPTDRLPLPKQPPLPHQLP